MRAILLALSLSAAAAGALQTLYVEERTDYKKGAAFGNAGAYERITATGTYGSAGAKTSIELLKPRDPTKGNGTLLFLIGRGPDEKTLLEAGFSLLRFQSPAPEAVRDVVSFLRYGGGSILLLSDQKQFQKRAIAFAAGADATQLASLIQAGVGKDEQGRRVFDAFWAHEASQNIPPKDEIPIRLTKGKSLEVLALQLHENLKAGK